MRPGLKAREGGVGLAPAKAKNPRASMRPGLKAREGVGSSIDIPDSDLIGFNEARA